MNDGKTIKPDNEFETNDVSAKIHGTSDIIETDIQDTDEAVSLSSLLYENDEFEDTHETVEEAANYQAFLNEFRSIMSKTLEEAKALSLGSLEKDETNENNSTEETGAVIQENDGVPLQENAEIINEESYETPTASTENYDESSSNIIDETDEFEAKYIIDSELNNDFEKNEKESSDLDAWGEGITLAPEEYEDPDEDENIFRKVPLEEEEPEEETDSEDEDNVEISLEEHRDTSFQISFNFDDTPSAIPQEEDEKPSYNPEKPRIIDSVFDFLELFIFTLLAVMLVTTFFFKHSIVEGDSMLNTLHSGDHLIISDVFYSPERGDIVVFEDYTTILKKAVIKRVIGLPGETVEVKRNSDGIYEVYIDGILLLEDYAYNEVTFTSGNEGKWVIGENEIFVLGDNRYNSTDSRHENVGPIDIDSILGKVIVRIYPFDRFGKVE